MTKVKLVTAYEGDCCYCDIAADNFQEYCDTWGYQFVKKFDGWSPRDVAVVWRKLETIRQELVDCDWLLWLDTDCLILNMTISLHNYIDESFDLGVTGPFERVGHCRPCPLDITPNRYSAGIMLIRQCEWSQKLLDDWWKAKDIQWWTDQYDCHWRGDSSWLSCNAMAREDRKSRIKSFDLKEIGWTHYIDSADQFILHFYGDTKQDKRDKLLTYSQCVIR